MFFELYIFYISFISQQIIIRLLIGIGVGSFKLDCHMEDNTEQPAMVASLDLNGAITSNYGRLATSSIESFTEGTLIITDCPTKL